MARIVGLDVGERRIGVAVSDASGILARPVTVVPIARLDAGAVSIIAGTVARLIDDEILEAIVVGLPRHLDGTPNAMTPRVDAFATALGAAIGCPIHLQDERLTSREAESLLALREKNWRERKKRLDAAAAALILQDYLDGRPRRPDMADALTDTDF